MKLRRLYTTGSVIVALLLSATAHAQVADKIIAVVGKNRIILQSELETAAAQTRQPGMEVTQDAKCNLLQQMILQKMLVEQAERDSLVVSDEEVEAALDNRVRSFVAQFGSKEKLEEVAGKTVFQLKEDNRDVIKESMMAEKVQNQLMQNVKITPAEVQAFLRLYLPTAYLSSLQL